MKLRAFRYLGSFEAFVKLRYGLRRRYLEWIYQRFSWLIIKQISKSANKFDDDIFFRRIDLILCIPENLQIDLKEKESIIESADKTLGGIYDLLGSGETVLHEVDWHKDFKSGYRWAPGVFFRKYKQEDISTSSDVKVPRELSRFHHLLKLGLAYKLTGETKYAEFCVAQIGDWINKNPLMYSINWGCTMDVAIRAVNWIWILGLISDAKVLDKCHQHKIKVSLYQHGWYIWRNPEKSSYNSSNHYLSDLVGQMYLGYLFRGMPEPDKWFVKGKYELFREIRYQILPTGMTYERSIYYNRLVFELILFTLLPFKNNGFEIPQDIQYRLEKMFEFIMYTLRPDGTAPVIGDHDNGRLLPFGTERINDFRYLLSLGAVLYQRTDFKNCSNGYNTYCMLFAEKDSLNIWNEIPQIPANLMSRAFPDSGFYVMRQGEDYLLFNASGKGLYPESGSGTHTHSDLLSFELYSDSKSFLIDPGSYVYTADAEMRLLFRSTAMHNTVCVDGESQNVLSKEVLWDFQRDAIPIVTKWKSDTDEDVIIATHNGYARLAQPVFHERQVTFHKKFSKWTILDSFSGEGSHVFTWYFHFDAGIDIVISGSTISTACTDGKNINIRFGRQDVRLNKTKSIVSKSYGVKEEAVSVEAVIRSEIPVRMKIEIERAI